MHFTIQAWFIFGQFKVTLAAQTRPSIGDDLAVRFRRFLRSLEALKTEKFQPMRVLLTRQQLRGAFAYSFRHFRSEETAMVQKEPKRAQIGLS